MYVFVFLLFLFLFFSVVLVYLAVDFLVDFVLMGIVGILVWSLFQYEG